MKTKIIYISGNEVFEMAQIRAAFEEVRSALGLDNDTILFGVPVDADNALANTTTETTVVQDTAQITETIEVCEEIIEPAPEITQIISEVIEQEIPTEIVAEIIPEPVQDIQPEPDIIEEKTEPEAEPVIPILSILSTNDDVPEQIAETSEPEIDAVAEATTIEQPEIDNTDTLTVSIDDIVTDEVPDMEHEKTLEELLESMEPLGEDETPELNTASEPTTETTATEDSDFSISMTDDVADTDATLAQLASEFAQSQDKIPNAPKPSGNGKIGKLKNILPFKKAKRDDSGLMGDLFGWAGIAANDEDFSIPGFFTSAGGQK